MKHPPKIGTKAWHRRLVDLLPRGVPRWVRIYDNGGIDAPGGSIDRYTCVFTGRYREAGGWFQYLAMNGAPFHPQGFCQHGESPDQIDVSGSSWAGPSIGKRCHLGLRIRFDDLPHDCQIVVLRDYCELWNIELPEGAGSIVALVRADY